MNIRHYLQNGNVTSKQQEIIEKLLILTDIEREWVEKVNLVHRPYQDAARRKEAFWGFGFKQISDLVIDREIVPMGYNAAAPYQAILDEVREGLHRTTLDAVSEDLGFLPFAQRNYEIFEGKQLPEKHLEPVH